MVANGDMTPNDDLIKRLGQLLMSEDIRKWTDGRYTLMFDEHTFFVFDNEKEKRMTALQVTKKLNEQQATINELRKKLKKYEDKEFERTQMRGW